MKKTTLKLIAVLISALLSIGFISCDKDKNNEPDTPGKVDPDNPNNPNDTINPPSPPPGSNPGQAKTPEEQKQYLETVALDFMNKVPASDFKTLGELGKFLYDIYFDYYDWSNVEWWGKDVYNAAREALGTTTYDRETNGYYTYTYIYTNYKALLMASNFTGHFLASHGYWSYESANDLQFIFADKQGQQLILKVETSGETAKVHAFDVNDWYDSYTQHSGNSTIYNDYYNRTACTIGVPEKIVVTLLQGQTRLIRTTVKIDLRSLNGQEFDLSKGNFTVSATTELNNGYKFDVSQVAYTGNSKASLSWVMSKNSTKLITMGVAGDISGIPSVNVSEFTSPAFDFDDYNIDDANAKNVVVSLDVLGKVQMKGTVADIRRYVDYLIEADENDYAEGTFKSYINQANALTDINVYYDGKSTKHASIRLEPFREEGWYQTYWTAEPVLVFYSDGSSYSTFEAFFNQSEFKRTINTFKTLANAYANIIGQQIDW